MHWKENRNMETTIDRNTDIEIVIVTVSLNGAVINDKYFFNQSITDSEIIQLIQQDLTNKGYEII